MKSLRDEVLARQGLDYPSVTALPCHIPMTRGGKMGGVVSYKGRQGGWERSRRFFVAKSLQGNSGEIMSVLGLK